MMYLSYMITLTINQLRYTHCWHQVFHAMVLAELLGDPTCNRSFASAHAWLGLSPNAWEHYGTFWSLISSKIQVWYRNIHNRTIRSFQNPVDSVACNCCPLEARSHSELTTVLDHVRIATCGDQSVSDHSEERGNQSMPLFWSFCVWLCFLLLNCVFPKSTFSVEAGVINQCDISEQKTYPSKSWDCQAGSGMIRAKESKKNTISFSLVRWTFLFLDWVHDCFERARHPQTKKNIPGWTPSPVTQ